MYDRGKVMSAEDLEAGKEFARYKDVDGDGIPWRTLPGTHETRGAYFTRGTSRNPQAIYSEAGPDYVYNMQRLQKKFEHEPSRNDWLIAPQEGAVAAVHPSSQKSTQRPEHGVWQVESTLVE